VSLRDGANHQGGNQQQPSAGTPLPPSQGGNDAHGGAAGDGRPAAPAISLPKGGGAIRGMGEKFAANPVTGTGSLSVPIYTSPGRSGFGPQLSLSYDSGAGNGPFGLGWNLSLPSITRKTDKGLPRYRDAEESDVFILSGAEDLVPALKDNGERDVVSGKIGADNYVVRRYRPHVEGLFARIERWTRQRDGATHWRSISKDNITTLYGKIDESGATTDSRLAHPRVTDPANPSHIFSWLICESYDDKGNAIHYEYVSEDSTQVGFSQANEANRNDKSRSANRYLKRIKYGNRTPREPGENLAQRTNWLFEVVFDYGEHDTDKPTPNDDGEWLCRHDPFSSYRAGFEVRTYRLCQRALMFHHFPDEEEVGRDCLVRSTDFAYRNIRDNAKDLKKGHPIASFIASATQTGYKRRPEGGYLKKSLPPLEFEYSQATIQDEVRDIDAESLENLPYGLDSTRYQWLDLDGEGASGILTEQAGAWFYKRNLGPISVEPHNGKGRPIARFAPVETITQIPSLAGDDGGREQFLDLAGDGSLDFVQFSGPVPGFCERTDDAGWDTFTPFASLPNLDWDDPNLRFVDLTGDGHADVLITEDEVFTWYPSLAEAGFGPAERAHQALDEEKGPRLVFADGTQSIYLADMSGDGLTDLVRICNGEVCYWTNLGYGRFGSRVTMDDAPWFDTLSLFDHQRVRLADIDGSGVTDIVYLGRDGVHLYFNRSGNSWSEAPTLNQFPHLDNLSSVTAVDLLGNGTACLVWSSPLPGDTRRPMRYVDLMGGHNVDRMSGQKPHLLVKVVNNLGAETRVKYAPSTRFYLEDELAGKPWITKLPFPVHVVERVETYDRITGNRFVTRYAYHHGYFDGVEREFRGFGMVEQWDTEEIGTVPPEETSSEAINLEVASYVPPVRTKTWFHTGAYLQGEKISLQFAHEYHGAPKKDAPNHEAAFEAFEATLLPDTVLPDTILLSDGTPPDGRRAPWMPSAEEEREACRALKGSILRQEVFGLDDTNKSGRPYTVSEHNYTIEVLQPQGANRHTVFFVHPRETIDHHHEREPEDPRTSHQFVLEVDNYGNVLKSAAVGYGRRGDALELTDDDRDKQKRPLITYTESSYTNAVDEPGAYRTPLPAETRTYELTGFDDLPKTKPFYTADDFVEKIEETIEGEIRARFRLRFAQEIDYEEARTSGRERRLIEHVRTLYRKDNLKAFLSLGALEPLALPGESYELAFTPGLLAQVYKRGEEDLLPTPPANVPGVTQGDQGGYVDLDNNGHWWIPSGKLFFDVTADPDGPAATATQEREGARKHFFLPRKYTDPFGHSSTVEHDLHDLLMVGTKDALENTVTAANDYRMLQPKRITDPNGNQTEVRFDALGMVAGTAVMGKNGQGDSFADFRADPPQNEIDQFFAKPEGQAVGLLGTATTRIIYDVTRYQREPDPAKKPPAFAATLARETHVSDLEVDQQSKIQQSKIQISFSYSDGFGREIQKKIQAEPGPLVEGGPIVSLRWVGSGWTIFNNKGKPVRRYEPFFDDTHDFRFANKVGISPILFYDPVERVVATLHPNHTWEKVVFDAWKQETWDVNDTLNSTQSYDPRSPDMLPDHTFDPVDDPDVGAYFRRLPENEYLPTWYGLRMAPNKAMLEWPDADPVTGAPRPENAAIRVAEAKAAKRAGRHASTPSIAHLDTLGRTFLTVADNGLAQDGTQQHYKTRVELDIEGNQLAVIDARERTVMRYDYDMVGNQIKRTSMDAGTRWMLSDVVSKPIYGWDSRDHRLRHAYDELQRPTGLFVRQGTGEEVLVERTIYGESHPDSNPSASGSSAPRKLNLRGKIFMQLDGAGVIFNVVRNSRSNQDEGYDFKGNLLSSRRRLARDYKQQADWLAIESHLDVVAPAVLNLASIRNALAPLLETETFTSSTAYDALNRPLTVTTPDNSVYHPTFNEANLLDKVDLKLRGAATSTPFVTNINYDPKGQRKLIAYGNGAQTAYEYDRLTFRLIHLKTTRPAGLNGLAPIFADPLVLQDLRYTYDPAGNIIRIEDAALSTVHHNGQRVEPVCNYTYDAIYRLIEASGREHIGQTAHDFDPPEGNRRDYPFMGHRAHPNDLQALRTYTECYEYDAVGNFQFMRHSANGDDWTRRYEYEEESLTEPGKQSNRLTRTTVGNGLNHIERYTYRDAQGNDVQGCMTAINAAINSVKMAWDFEDQLQQVDLGGGGQAHFVYDAGGQRVRKVIHRQNGNPQKERIYLGGYEIYREYNGNGQTVTLERETLHVMDDKQRIALVETRTGPTVGQSLIRYELGNHLGSASLELDKRGGLISYEEYHPYGTTAFQAKSVAEMSLKRYRYTGKERDEETGLYYYGARYYAPWLGIWTSCDPAGLSAGFNLFAFCHSNPIRLTDPNGAEPFDPTKDRLLGRFEKWLLYENNSPMRDAVTNDKNLENVQVGIAVATVSTVVAIGTGGASVALGATTVEAGIIGGASGGMASAYHGAAIQGRLPSTREVATDTIVGGVTGGGVAAVESKVIPAIVARTVPKRNLAPAVGAKTAPFATEPAAPAARKSTTAPEPAAKTGADPAPVPKQVPAQKGNKSPQDFLGEAEKRTAARRAQHGNSDAVASGKTRYGMTRRNEAQWRELRDIWDHLDPHLGTSDILSPVNRDRIARGLVPRVDDNWVRHFPGDAPHMGQNIPLHHVGGTFPVVPLPKPRHMDAHMPGGTRYNPGGGGTSG
jgi:RHS repeat-associated protein